MGHRAAISQELSQPCVGDLVAHFVKWEQLILVVPENSAKTEIEIVC